MRVLVTGASGFIGQALLRKLQLTDGIEAVAGVRGAEVSARIAGANFLVLGDLGDADVDPVLLRDIDVVVHCAARAHVMNDIERDPLEAFRRVNVRGSAALARAAVEAGVSRFVFLSSIKVNGEATNCGIPFTPSDTPAPIDAYGRSKWEAEQALLDIAKEGRMEVVIIRPPLVYGPNVGANFKSLMKWVSKGVPLPFGSIYNKRSLVGLPNLVDLLAVCLAHPAAANQVFMVSDGHDLSTTELLSRISVALGRRPRLLAVPSWLLQMGAQLFGRADIAQRLCGSLQVSIEKNRDCLGWVPPVTCDQALLEAAEHFRKEQK